MNFKLIFDFCLVILMRILALNRIVSSSYLVYSNSISWLLFFGWSWSLISWSFAHSTLLVDCFLYDWFQHFFLVLWWTIIILYDWYVCILGLHNAPILLYLSNEGMLTHHTCIEVKQLNQWSMMWTLFT